MLKQTGWLGFLFFILIIAVFVMRQSGPVAVAVDHGEFRASELGKALPWSQHRFEALVIGINDYRHWGKLRNAVADARAVGETLAKKYGFVVTGLYDGQATREAIIAELNRVADRKDDTSLLVYLAGHGSYDERLDRGYFIPADGRLDDTSKSSWIPNSTIHDFLCAPGPRHMLLVADTCYSGALFRGGVPLSAGQVDRFAAEFKLPSRYLITSGDLNPVPDTGAPGHSPFADALLGYLNDPAKPVFNMADLGQHIQGRVPAQAEREVRHGPLLASLRRSGQFLFVNDKVRGLSAEALAAYRETPATVQDYAAATRVSPAEMLAEGALLRDQGASATAGRLADTLKQDGEVKDSATLAALLANLGADAEERQRSEIRRMLEDLGRQRPAAGPGPDHPVASPRVVAMYEFEAPAGARGASWMVQSHLLAAPGLVPVDRKMLARVLQEMQISTTADDAEVRLRLGKLLPASLILGGEVLPAGDGWRVHADLIETVTGRIVAKLESEPFKPDTQAAVTARLAADIAAACRRRQALEAPLQAGLQGVKAGIGTFHNANAAMKFEVVRRTPMPGNPFQGAKDEPLGEATLTRLGDRASDFTVAWKAGAAPDDTASLWVRERVE